MTTQQIKDAMEALRGHKGVKQAADMREDVVRVVLAAVAHPTVTTEAELDALPVGSVVRNALETIYEKANFHGDPEFPFWITPGLNREFASVVITLPATVLYRGAGA